MVIRDRPVDTIRVLHIETGRHVYGGAQQVLYLLEHLAPLGVESALLCTRGAEIGGHAAALGVPVFEGAPGGDLDPRLLRDTLRGVRAWQADIVHVHSRRGADTWGLLGGRLAGARVVLSRRVDNTEPRWMAALRYRLPDHIICIAEGVRSVLAQAGVNESRMSVVHSAIDPSHFSLPVDRRAFCDEFGVRADAPILGIAAQLIPRKGHRLAFSALSQLANELPDLQLLVLGRGPEEGTLRAEVERLQLTDRVIFAGFRTDLPRWLGGLDILVHPAYTEGLGIVLLQAAAARVPAIGTRAGGIPEAMGDGRTGLLIPPGDAGALAEAIRSLVTDADLRARFAEAGPAHVAGGFTPARLAAGNRRVYDLVLRDSRTGRR